MNVIDVIGIVLLVNFVCVMTYIIFGGQVPNTLEWFKDVYKNRKYPYSIISSMNDNDLADRRKWLEDNINNNRWLIKKHKNYIMTYEFRFSRKRDLVAFKLGT